MISAVLRGMGDSKRPMLFILIATVINLVLDIVFTGYWGWGVAGAAATTALSQFVGGMVPFLFFARKNSSKLHLTKTRMMGRELLRACTNGSSELVTNVSMSLVGMLYNMQLMKIAGENGVAAYGVIMYINFIFLFNT